MASPRDDDLDRLSLRQVAARAATCTACELYESATQVVFGEGPSKAPIMLLGEQPGDQEDREGQPFVGPSGRELDRAIDEAGIDRSDVYVTNVVKHFRFEMRGKRRLHNKPTRRHIEACRPWLNTELAKVDPAVIVCLGSSAAQALLGSGVKVMEDHGVPVDWEGFLVVPTIHPSFILRTPDHDGREQLFRLLVSDLGVAADLASSRRD